MQGESDWIHVLMRLRCDSLVGLMITYSLSITQSLNWVVRSATEVETNVSQLNKESA